MMTTDERFNLWRRELLEMGYSERELPPLPAEPEMPADEPVAYYDRRALRSEADSGNALVCFALCAVFVMVGVFVQWLQATFLPIR